MRIICECKTCPETKIYESDSLAVMKVIVPEIIAIAYNFNIKHQGHTTSIRTGTLMLGWREI